MHPCACVVSLHPTRGETMHKASPKNRRIIHKRSSLCIRTTRNLKDAILFLATFAKGVTNNVKLRSGGIKIRKDKVLSHNFVSCLPRTYTRGSGGDAFTPYVHGLALSCFCCCFPFFLHTQKDLSSPSSLHRNKSPERNQIIRLISS